MQIFLLVGTMTGTAQLVAQELELVWDDGENRVETLLMDKLDAGVFAREGVFLLVTSTYGQGDIPDNAKAFYEDLSAKRPDLSAVTPVVVMHAMGHAFFTLAVGACALMAYGAYMPDHQSLPRAAVAVARAGLLKTHPFR